jgi:hypothetical protein
VARAAAAPQAAQVQLSVNLVRFDDPCAEFDTAWCADACSGNRWKAEIDPMTSTRARVTHADGTRYTTIRAAAPLPRRVPSTGTTSQQQLPSDRVVIEAYPTDIHAKITRWWHLGFMPSHNFADGTAVTPGNGGGITSYGGWYIQVSSIGYQLGDGALLIGWRPLVPRAAAAAGAAAEDVSDYATTDGVPAVPPGCAVEFAVAYAAGTCRVAFYTPAAVAGGFVAAPYAKMELRFGATAAANVPGSGEVRARSVPTAAANSRLHLYPVVSAGYAGAVCRFV